MKNIYMGNTIYTDEEIRKFADGSDRERYPNTDWIQRNAVKECSAASAQHYRGWRTR